MKEGGDFYVRFYVCFDVLVCDKRWWILSGVSSLMMSLMTSLMIVRCDILLRLRWRKIYSGEKFIYNTVTKVLCTLLIQILRTRMRTRMWY